MAVGTYIPTGNMVRCLAGGDHTIVATGTRTLYLRMVNPGCGYPGGVPVTALTEVRCEYMVAVLTSG